MHHSIHSKQNQENQDTSSIQSRQFSKEKSLSSPIKNQKMLLESNIHDVKLSSHSSDDINSRAVNSTKKKKELKDEAYVLKKRKRTPKKEKESSSPLITSKNKCTRTYEKKNKRFTWPEELHRIFVAAIFDVGLKHASPKTLLSLMGDSAIQCSLTTEHLKSHLQKYRQNYERSKEQFMLLYEESLRDGVDWRSKKKEREMEENVPFSTSSTNQTLISQFPVCMSGLRSTENPSIEQTENSSSQEPTTLNENENEKNEKLDEKESKDQSNTLQYQVALQARNLELQAKYQEDLQKQLFEQRLLQRELQERISRMNQMNSTPNESNESKESVESSIALHKKTMPSSISTMSNNIRVNRASLPSHALHSNTSPTHASSPKNKESSVSVVKDSKHTGSSMNASNNRRNMTNISWRNPGSTVSSSTRSGSSSSNQGIIDPHMASLDSLLDINGYSMNSQLEMHMAMQSQMNLHRQMLLRKVEVSQYGLPSGSSHSYGNSMNQRSAVSTPVSLTHNSSPTSLNHSITSSSSLTTASTPTFSLGPSNPIQTTTMDSQLGVDLHIPPMESYDAMEWDKLNLDNIDLADDEELFSFLKD